MKPKSKGQLKRLVAQGAIEVLVEEPQLDGTILFFVHDHRRTYEDGELYEIRLGKPQ